MEGSNVASPAMTIDARGLTHAYGDQIVLSGIDIQVRRGEFFGFLGRNGAGKSTAIRALCGLLQPDGGEITVAGIDVRRDPIGIRRYIGILSDDIVLYDRLSGSELLDFAGQMHGLSRAEAHRRGQDLIERLDLAESCHRPISSYSLGMRRKTAFAAALIHTPRALFLDEPFNGVDALSARTLCGVLRWLCRERGVAVLFTSHVMEMAERMCDRIAILHNGAIQAEGAVDILMRDAADHGESLEEIFLSLTGAREARQPALDWY